MQILVSILLVVIGLSTGVAASIVFNNAKENNASKKAEVIIEKAKKDGIKTYLPMHYVQKIIVQ